MTIEELKKLCADGGNVILVRKRGARIPTGFPRGELLCENSTGDHCYSHDSAKILSWIAKRAKP